MKLKFDFIKRADKGRITTVKDLESLTFRGLALRHSLCRRANVRNVNSLDKTKFLFRALPFVRANEGLTLKTSASFFLRWRFDPRRLFETNFSRITSAPIGHHNFLINN